MDKGFIFWLLMILWFIFGMYWNFPRAGAPNGPYWGVGNTVLLFALFFILGWHNFGFVIH